MKHDVINIEGKKTTNVELSEKIFSLKPNAEIIKSIITFTNDYRKIKLLIAFIIPKIFFY